MNTRVCNIELTLEFTQRYKGLSKPDAVSAILLRREERILLAPAPLNGKVQQRGEPGQVRFIKPSQVGIHRKVKNPGSKATFLWIPLETNSFESELKASL